ncbi:MAG: stress response translation initiation inhibitor YciH [Thermoleophilia bacterium]
MSGGNTENSRLVYSSDVGRVEEERRAAPVPEGDGVVRVSRTKAGRKGKTVTLVTGLPPGDIGAVAKELKKLCGSGGAVKDGVVELQGDHRDKVVAALGGRYRVKPAGG